jgi:DNA-binding transcriptional MocR family regulator
VPTGLDDLFINARIVSGRHSPMLEQAIVARFMDEGHLGRHVRRLRILYSARRTALADAMAPSRRPHPAAADPHRAPDVAWSAGARRRRGSRPLPSRA